MTNKWLLRFFPFVGAFPMGTLRDIEVNPDLATSQHEVAMRFEASGEEGLHHAVERLRESGLAIMFSGLGKQILDVMRATGLFDLLCPPPSSRAKAH